MKRTAVMMAMAMLVSAGLARAQESVAAGPASPVQGGQGRQVEDDDGRGRREDRIGRQPGDQRWTGQGLDIRDRRQDAGDPGSDDLADEQSTPKSRVTHFGFLNASSTCLLMSL